jgi:hypothetical protein
MYTPLWNLARKRYPDSKTRDASSVLWDSLFLCALGDRSRNCRRLYPAHVIHSAVACASLPRTPTMYLPFTLPALLLAQVPTRINPFAGHGTLGALDIPRPDPPAPHGYEDLPDAYASALDAAWGKLEAQLAAPESDWTCAWASDTCAMRGADGAQRRARRRACGAGAARTPRAGCRS